MQEGIYYTHGAAQQSDGTLAHTTQDHLAFVLRENEDGSRDLVVFPVGGPVQFVHAEEFDPDNPYNVVGGGYYREGGDPPDFSSFDATSHPRLAQLRHRQLVEKNSAQARGDSGKHLEEMRARHKQEQDNLRAELGAGEDKPEPEAVPQADNQRSIPRQDAPADEVPPNGRRV